MNHKPSHNDQQCTETGSAPVVPATRPINPTPEDKVHDHLAKREADAESRQEALLDEALEESFPGSDPISPKHIT